MKQRTSQPKNNKYYIRKPQGGLSDAIAGKPTIKGANVLCNCVGYANSRFNEIWNDPELKGIVKAFHVQLVCNAENFIESAKRQGLSISSTPIEGGIMVWQKGSLKNADGAGHVAVVEEVRDDGTIITSESGWDAWAFKRVQRSNENGRWGQNSAYKFRGCIINPGVPDPKVVPAPPLTVDGIGGPATIRALQRFLGTPMDGEISGQLKKLAKYHPAIEAVRYGSGGSACVKALQKWLGITADGQWGKATSKALQYCIGVDDDGIFGPASVRALQKFLNANKDAKATIPKKPAASKPAAAAPAPAAPITTSGGSLTAKARELAWPKGTAKKKYAWKGGAPTTAFKAALERVFPAKERKKWGKAPRKGCSCDVFAATCVRDAGIGGKCPRGLREQYKYKPKNMTRKVYKNRKPIDVSKDGDFVVYAKNSKKTKGHALIRGDGGIFEAGFENTYGHFNGSLKKLKTKRPYVVVFRPK